MADYEITTPSLCPACGSTDAHFVTERMMVHKMEIVVAEQNCNNCPARERWVRVIGILVFHDVVEGNVTRVVYP